MHPSDSALTTDGRDWKSTAESMLPWEEMVAFVALKMQAQVQERIGCVVSASASDGLPSLLDLRR